MSPSRSDAGLPESGFVFCSFNNPSKLTPAMFGVWMRILARTENTVLWLFETNGLVRENLKREAAKHGLDASRLVFGTRLPHAEHLARLRLADLVLDTLPYNAHTTASDALWVGVPLLTCLGSTFAGRVGASILMAAGLPDMITRSFDEYENLSIKLATEPELLKEIRQRLMQNRDTCALFDTPRFARHIEAAFVRMWERQRQGDRPDAFAVEAIT